MSDFALNNWEFSKLVEKYGKENALKGIKQSRNEVLPAPTQIDGNRQGTLLREPDYNRTIKKKDFNGPFLNTKRPPARIPHPTVLVTFSNNQNTFSDDQQIHSLDYYV